MNSEIPSIESVDSKLEKGPDKEVVEETMEEQDVDSTVEGSVEDAEGFGMQNHVEAINSIISQYEPRVEEAYNKAERHTRGAKGYASDWPSVYAYDHGSRQWHEKHKGAVFGAKAVMGATTAFHQFMKWRLENKADGVEEKGRSKVGEYMNEEADAAIAVEKEFSLMQEEITKTYEALSDTKDSSEQQQLQEHVQELEDRWRKLARYTRR